MTLRLNTFVLVGQGALQPTTGIFYTLTAQIAAPLAFVKQNIISYTEHEALESLGTILVNTHRSTNINSLFLHTTNAFKIDDQINLNIIGFNNDKQCMLSMPTYFISRIICILSDLCLSTEHKQKQTKTTTTKTKD